MRLNSALAKIHIASLSVRCSHSQVLNHNSIENLTCSITCFMFSVISRSCFGLGLINGILLM